MKGRQGAAVYLPDHFATKTSEAILFLAEDFLVKAETHTAYKSAIILACIAWNLATLVPEEEREDSIDQLTQSMTEEMRQNMQVFFNLLIKKKNHYYPDLNSSVVDYDIIVSEGILYVNIASSQ